MKIVYCIPSLHNSGGMERVLTEKANYLADVCGYNITIITTSQNGRPNFYSLSEKVELVDLDINYDEIFALPITKRIQARLKAKSVHKRKLELELKKLRPDITISMFTHEMSFLPKIEDGSKKVLELHFSKSFRALDAKSNNQKWYLRLIGQLLDKIDRRTIRNYDKFVVLTHRDAYDWGTEYSNLEVIPNPTTFETTVSDLTDPAQKKVLAVGRLCPQKGFDVLIKAWSKVPVDFRKDWKLEILGSGPDYDMLKAMIEKMSLDNSVSILPPTNDIVSQYKSHSIFCFPSRYEGFGLALVEAMSFGLSSIAVDCQCGPSDIITDGVNGFLANVDDANKIAERLTELMSNTELRRKYGLEASKHVNANFSKSAVMEMWIKLFQNL